MIPLRDEMIHYNGNLDSWTDENGQFIPDYSHLSGRLVNYRANPTNPYPVELGLTISSEPFDVGGKQCVWLKEKSHPVLFISLERAKETKRGYDWSKGK